MYKCLIIIGLMGVLLMSAGCGKTMLERHWGDSFESAKLNQILNLEAGENLEPVIGLDPGAAGSVLGTDKGPKAQETPAEVFTPNVESNVGE